MSNLEKINEIICDSFHIKNVENISDELGPDDIEGWDSMAHVEMITAFEEEFEIAMDVIDVSRMYTIGDIKKILKKYDVEI
ncbi:acyl carrier protein [Clostridium aestuarii]|uniref:Acyl carrier protein n=1 Tax=Clostridium aestuarii TaxID=338193 RepID=A0ABT4D2R2_9CLOT|nr:acyl carrier protein [Clostridium aestuarii]MCY6484328.1 acyl carrier protein [Clostridium aestuarii]